MITNKRLTIFEDFEIDRKLLKYIKEQKNDNTFNGTISSFNISEGGSSISDPTFITGAHLDYLDYLKKHTSIALLAKIKMYIFKKLFTNFFEIDITEKKIDPDKVLEFFKNIKSNITELTYDEKTIDKYIKIIENAKKTGQVALIENLIRKKDVLLLESILIKSNIKTYINEELIIEFYSKFNTYKNKQLKLTWVKNFNRLIPDDVIVEKLKADNLKVFDNYVVLHYDKNNDQTKLTKKEIEKLKDPILFGVIKGSSKLYFIGDWEDEHCDLTLDKLLEKMDTAPKNLETIPNFDD